MTSKKRSATGSKSPRRKGVVQTTVRLPEDLHTLLKEASARGNETAEKFIQRAVERALPSDANRVLSDPAIELYEAIRRTMETFRESFASTLSDLEGVQPLEKFQWSEWEAYRFLQNLPVMTVIKNKRKEIVWCNRAYEELCGLTLLEMRGRTLDSIGLVTDERDRLRIDQDIARVLERGKSLEAIESVHIRGRMAMLMRVFRFVFKSDGQEYLGDLSFDFFRVGAGHEEEARPFRLRLSTEDSIVPALCKDFLGQACPSSVAIKDRGRRILWANQVFLSLLGADSLRVVQGRKSEDLLNLPPHHEITRNDVMVARTAHWKYCPEDVPGWGERTTVRFPIFDEFTGRVQRIGILGAHFQKNVGYQGVFVDR